MRESTAVRLMSHKETSQAMLLDELASLDPLARQEMAEKLRQVAETFAAVPDGKTASHVLGVLADLLHPAGPGRPYTAGRPDMVSEKVFAYTHTRPTARLCGCIRITLSHN